MSATPGTHVVTRHVNSGDTLEVASEYPKNGRTIRFAGMLSFRSHGMFFRNESLDPKILTFRFHGYFIDYPDEAINSLAFINTNLEYISVERVHHYIFTMSFYYGLHLVVSIWRQIEKKSKEG